MFTLFEISTTAVLEVIELVWCYETVSPNRTAKIISVLYYDSCDNYIHNWSYRLLYKFIPIMPSRVINCKAYLPEVD